MSELKNPRVLCGFDIADRPCLWTLKWVYKPGKSRPFELCSKMHLKMTEFVYFLLTDGTFYTWGDRYADQSKS